MGWIDLIRFAALNLWRRRARTLLTTFGVVIGTVCIILMFALGLASYKQFEEYYLNNKSLTEINVSAGMGGTKLNDNALASFLAIEDVEAATPVLYLPVYIDAGEYETNYNISVLAMDRDYIKDNLEFKEGTLFDDSGMPQLVIGYYTQQQFIKDGEEPDDQSMFYMEDNGEEKEITMPFDYKSQPLKMYLGSNPEQSGMSSDNPVSKRYPAVITGILKKDDYGNTGYNAYMSLDAAKLVIQQNRKLAENYGISTENYTEGLVRAKDIKSISKIVKTINNMGYQAYGMGQDIENIQKDQASRQAQLVMIGAIALFVSAIGIANTMLTSILERKREIGIMKVAGLAMKKIRRMFLIEAAVIGLSGGVIGSLISYIVSFAVNNGSGSTEVLGMYFQEGMVLSIPLWLTFAGIGIAVFVGVAAGFYPAWKATKLSPMEAIRGN